MNKLSEGVKKLEDELAKLKAAVRGNCVLVNREGFSKPMFVDDVSLHGFNGVHGCCPPLRRIRMWESRDTSFDPYARSVVDNTGAAHSRVKEVTYHNTGRLDEFGRVILLEEIP